MHSSIEDQIRKGQEYQENGLLDEAIKEYKEALEINPDNAEAHKYLADAYYDKQLEKEAIVEYRASIRINPKYVEARHNLGLLFYQLGLYSDAIIELKEALNIEPGNADTLSILAMAYIDKGMFDEGMQTARGVLKINPNSAIAHYSLGGGYHNKELFNDAEKEYLEAIRLDPNLEGAALNLGIVREQKKGKTIDTSVDEDEIPYINKNDISKRRSNVLEKGVSTIINSSDVDTDLRLEIITKLLLENRPDTDTLFWGPLSNKNGQKLNKKNANEFLFFCIFDYQMSANYVWDNCEKFVKNALDDPENLWDTIVSYSLDEWMKLSQKYSLHRFPHARERAYRIAEDMVRQYHGDARNIWEGQPINIVRERIYDLVGGDAIPRMIMGALKDSGHIKGILDVKPDVHVKTVLGRVFTGRILSDDEATLLTRRMNPEDPWAIDAPLYLLGRDTCQKSKCYCDICYLQRECIFYKTEVKDHWVKSESN